MSLAVVDKKEINVSLVFNQKGDVSYRVKKLKGRTYYVCPIVMLMEGVFTCNEGPVLYREKELHTFQEAWNNKPIVVYHPQNKKGDFVTASTEDVLEKQQVGFLLNSRWDGKLKASAWIDVETCRELRPDLVKRVEQHDPIEVSTGLVVNVLSKKGKYKGKKYDYIAMDYRPDHLALLPDKVGACSLADGAGLMVMQSFDGKPIPEDLRKLAGLQLDKLLTNQLTNSRLRELLQALLKTWGKNAGDSYVWIEDTTEKDVMFQWGGKLWRMGYKNTGDVVSLAKGDPEEVQRVMQYRLVDGVVIANTSTKDNEQESSVKKDEMVSFLIANGGYEESDKGFLDTLTEAKLTKMVKPLQKTEKKVVANEETDDEKLTKKKAKESDTSGDFDFDAFMSKAPKKFQRTVARSIALMNEAVAEDAAIVVKLSGGTYTTEECESMDPLQLAKLKKTLVNAAGKKASVADDDDETDDDDDEFGVADFSGASGFSLGSRFVGNTKGKESDEEDAPLGTTPSTFVSKK